MSDETFACGVVIYFKDGAEPEEQVYHVGTYEECERMGVLLPAVAYRGARHVERAEFVIVPHEEASS